MRSKPKRPIAAFPPVSAAPVFPVLAGALLGACSMLPTSPVSESAMDMADAFSGSTDSSPYEPLEWWKSFDDPVLDQVVEAVLDSGFDIAIAVARVDQARATARIANAIAFPLVRPSVGSIDFETPTNAGIGAQLDELGLDDDVYAAFGVVLPDRLGLTTYSVGGDFAYEVDFWGRNRSSTRAAGAERLASESDFQAARIGILSETVGTYIEIADLRRQRDLARETLRILQDLEQLATTRYDRGLIPAGALYAAQRNLSAAQAELPQLEARLADAEGRLWVLMGGYRADLASVLPDSPSPSAALDDIPAGVPADLLAQRPDVSAARQRMEASRLMVGARRAELLPSLSLSGSIGLQATDTNEWFDSDQWFQNLSVNLLAPAFQGARLRSNVALAEATLDEAAAAYGRSVVTAVNEVESALAGWEAGRQRHSLLSAHADSARAEAILEERRYLSGVGDYATYLAASQTLVSANSALAAAERELGLARLALHRALGGAWTRPGSTALRRNETASAADTRIASAATE